MSWADVSFFGNMKDCLIPHTEDKKVRYRASEDKNELEKAPFSSFKQLACAQKSTLGVTFAGKNMIKDEDIARINQLKQLALEDLYAVVKARSGGDDPVKHIVIYNQGDLHEPNAPFSTAQKEFLEQAPSKLPDVLVHMVVIKGVQPSHYSQGLIDSWADNSAYATPSTPDVKFAIIGTTPEEDAKKATFGFSQSHIVYFIGSDEQQKYMYATDKEGKRRKTTGYNQLCQLRVTMNERKALDQPHGLAILERAE
jgi:hypothetical protein